MSSKIIFWINDALAFVGLPKILQEKYNFDIYGVLDITDKHKKFFQNQKLINFSKIWYFHDHILKTVEKPNTEYLKLIEKKYKIDLGLLASNDRFFNKFNEFYKFSNNEILSILEQESKNFEKILDDIKPDYIIMVTPYFHHDSIFFNLCKSKGITVLDLDQTRFPNRCVISFDKIKEK